jgi:hypothetical protein
VSVLLANESASGPRSVRSCFLIGAPRCGTTFIAKALARHPEICFSKPKETHFFVRDYAKVPAERWQAEFLHRYFAHLEPRHALIAEGSPLQLRDPDAIRRLLRFDPETRFLVAVRNPVDMAYSYHARLVYLLDEDERDFERAWELQPARARGERVPRRCRDVGSLQYRAMCSLGTQLENLFEQVGRERVHVIVFDDLVQNPVKLYRDMLEFLELRYDGRTRFERKNEHRDFRHDWAQSWVMNPPRPVAALLEAWQRTGRSRPRWVRDARRRLKRWNTRRAKRAPLAAPMRERLRAELAGEVTRLEQLLGRDFSTWR